MTTTVGADIELQKYLQDPYLSSVRVGKLLGSRNIVTGPQVKYWASLGLVRESNPIREHQRLRKVYSQEEFRKVYYMGLLVNYLGFIPKNAARVADRLMSAPAHNGKHWVEYTVAGITMQVGVTALEQPDG